ncbi:molybdopterin synthase subunit MoaD [Sphaerotilus hippei]|uniref:Molybdopterin synthase subunit MoaD n=1 Tax=Sphaerotilus hippei TaxID=744406 RepID=A0A318H4V0_9BURK|nr:MoaD/ThiS family protein [Sphaerotilus hippei]PXW98201.1 molybdopterin synthase subunit MoaD [Sphaerotilus hippei]
MTTKIRIRLRYFASLREALGSEETLEIDGPASVAAVRDQLIARGDPHAGVLARGRPLRSALNQVLCPESTLVDEGAELAFFPPVTGG